MTGTFNNVDTRAYLHHAPAVTIMKFTWQMYVNHYSLCNCVGLPPKKLAMQLEMVFHRERNITLQGCPQLLSEKG